MRRRLSLTSCSASVSATIHSSSNTAEAPCTVLAVKDRVTGHNPLAAVYTLDSYYRALK